MRTKFTNAYMRYMVSMCYHIWARQKGPPLCKRHSKIRFQSTFTCSMILLKSGTKFPADTKSGLVEVMAFCRTDNVDRNVWRHMASLEFMQSMPKRHITPILLRKVIRACFFLECLQVRIFFSILLLDLFFAFHDTLQRQTVCHFDSEAIFISRHLYLYQAVAIKNWQLRPCLPLVATNYVHLNIADHMRQNI